MAEADLFKLDIPRSSTVALVAEKLTAMIDMGLLRAGDTLPSERDLARSFAVSRETVRMALQGLATLGRVGVSHGTRTRVPECRLGRCAAPR